MCSICNTQTLVKRLITLHYSIILSVKYLLASEGRFQVFYLSIQTQLTTEPIEFSILEMPPLVPSMVLGYSIFRFQSRFFFRYYTVPYLTQTLGAQNYFRIIIWTPFEFLFQNQYYPLRSKITMKRYTHLFLFI